MTETLTGELLVRKVQPEGDRSVAEADLRSQGSSTDYELDLVADRLPHSGHDDAVLDAPVGEEYDDMDNSSTHKRRQKIADNRDQDLQIEFLVERSRLHNVDTTERVQIQ